MDIAKAALLKEAMDRVGELRADPKHRAVFIGARPKMRDGAQELVRMTFLLQRIGIGAGAEDIDAVGLKLPFLACAGGRYELTFDSNRRTRTETLIA